AGTEAPDARTHPPPLLLATADPALPTQPGRRPGETRAVRIAGRRLRAAKESPMRLLALVLLAAVGPTATAAPTISGVAEQGHKLTASPGTWTGSGTVATAYNWFRCDGAGGHCSSIHGATGASYTVVAKDVGHTLALNVRATDATGTTTASTALVGPVAAADTALTATAQPAITGEAVVGQQLTVGAGTWSAAPTSTSDAWYRCNANGRVCAPIAGATAATYIPVTADAGHALVALVLAKTATTAQSAYSTATPAVVPAAGPVATVAPSVAGTALQGQRLVASQGTWTGTGTLAYAYQWYRCDATGAHCSSIHGATAAGYKLVAKDVLHTI